MHFSPFLLLKAPKWRFPQLYTLWYPRRKCKVGENVILGLPRAEMVRNTCFHIKYKHMKSAATHLFKRQSKNRAFFQNYRTFTLI